MMKQSVKEILGYFVNGISIPVFFFLFSALKDSPRHIYLTYIGWILLGLGVFFILGSFYTLVRYRGKGLIDWGIYGIVRHPMYVGAMLIFLSWTFFLSHWLTLSLSLINVAIVYWFVLQEDRRNKGFFGSDYEHYMERVPRANFVSGFANSLKK
jgi:protein-S-isoprenylcysteine O-methyltransferase Ste14